MDKAKKPAIKPVVKPSMPMPKPKAKKAMPMPMEEGADEMAQGMPDEIADKLQTMKNEKAYKNYEDTRSLGSTFKKGGKVGSASKRADGCAQRGKTRGKMC
jgi:UDP-N-acetylenolpyruvoylglucosamine reductase